jgi:drug/metabolite transporter (DMT)-like permease
MTPATHLAAVLCVGMIAGGQVLFKYAAKALGGGATFFDRDVLLLVVAAFAIYGIATVIWILLLQEAALSRLYPYMALSFVLVALAGRVLFAEAITPGQVAGLAMIVGGLLVIAATANP